MSWGRAPGGGGDDHTLGRGGGSLGAAGTARHLYYETHGGGGEGSHPAQDIERESSEMSKCEYRCTWIKVL